MASYKVEICGVNTSTLPILKESEKKDLFVRIKNGDLTARETYIRGNLRLVLSVIRRFSASNENVDDLFQIGCIGLIKSIDNFDPSLDVKFSTYAVPMIIGEIRRYLRDNNAIRVSRSLRDTAYRALRTREELTVRAGKEPKVSEIAQAMELPEGEVAAALEAVQDPVSLFDPVYQDGGDAIYVMDQLRDERVNEEDWVRDLSIQQALNHLAERERSIINRRFFQGRTQMEVAAEIGSSQAQVSRLEKSALQQMRRYMQ